MATEEHTAWTCHYCTLPDGTLDGHDRYFTSQWAAFKDTEAEERVAGYLSFLAEYEVKGVSDPGVLDTGYTRWLLDDVEPIRKTGDVAEVAADVQVEDDLFRIAYKNDLSVRWVSDADGDEIPQADYDNYPGLSVVVENTTAAVRAVLDSFADEAAE